MLSPMLTGDDVLLSCCRWLLLKSAVGLHNFKPCIILAWPSTDLVLVLSLRFIADYSLVIVYFVDYKLITVKLFHRLALSGSPCAG